MAHYAVSKISVFVIVIICIGFYTSYFHFTGSDVPMAVVNLKDCKIRNTVLF